MMSHETQKAFMLVPNDVNISLDRQCGMKVETAIVSTMCDLQVPCTIYNQQFYGSLAGNNLPYRNCIICEECYTQTCCSTYYNFGINMVPIIYSSGLRLVKMFNILCVTVQVEICLKEQLIKLTIFLISFFSFAMELHYKCTVSPPNLHTICSNIIKLCNFILNIWVCKMGTSVFANISLKWNYIVICINRFSITLSTYFTL